MASRLVVFSVSFILLFWFFAPETSAQKKVEVDVALVLAVDCSYSVSKGEFDLQMQGLAQALASAQVIAAIRQGPIGRIAVTVVQWSSTESQKIVIPWTLVGGASSARRVATAISNAPRLTADGATSISAVIDFSIYQLVSSPVTALRYVIDISSDGYNNNGERPEPARDRALVAGITINGLTILNEVDWLHYYFKNHITVGTGNFVMVANDYEAYGTAIKRKLIKEIKGLPVS